MRIALYGMPSSGKTTLLSQIGFIPVLEGSHLLKEIAPNFHNLNETEKTKAREMLATKLLDNHDFIMDGHYAFDDRIVFTKADGELYDVFLYLYVDPEVLRKRMLSSEKDQKYANVNLVKWQQAEIIGLRNWCHEHNKDFYILDCPPTNVFDGLDEVIAFIRDSKDGFSCIRYACEISNMILGQSVGSIILADGDKTITTADSSNIVFGYRTHLFDGNFYTGYQSWKQSRDFQNFVYSRQADLPVPLNMNVMHRLNGPSYILTAGHNEVWRHYSEVLGLPYFAGREMAADTKYFVTKFLREAGRIVEAFGDSMNDYYMLKEANKGYLVRKEGGSISRSLRDVNTEGLLYV